MNLSRMLIIAGLLLAGIGVLLALAEKANLPLGRLPGDLIFRGKNTTVYFPIITCIVLSILGSLLLWLFNRR